MANIKLKDRSGTEQTYSNVNSVTIPNASGGGSTTFVSGGISPLDKTVTFIDQSTNYAIQSVKSTGKIVAPEQPTVPSGWTFKGWGTTASASSYRSFPYTPTLATENLYANYVAASRVIVTGYGSSSPSSVSWTTDSGFSFNFEEVTADGNVFIKIPTMYRKVDTTYDGQITGFTISDTQIDSSYQPYSVFVKEDGSTVMPYVLIGKYRSSSAVGSNLNSVAGSSAVTRAIGEARTYARAVGTGYQQWDWQFQKLWQDLICAKMQTININSGAGIEVDQLGVVWNKSGTWVDGLACPASGSNWVFSYKPSQYVDSPSASTTGYQSAGYVFPTGSSVEISKLGYDSNNPFFNQPTATTTNTSYNTYYCDGWYYSSGSARPLHSGVGTAYADYGAFRSHCNISWSDTRGVRLCYRPL